MAHLPRGWRGKRAVVVFDREEGGGIEATLVSDNAGGLELEVVEGEGEKQDIRKVFMPWSAVRYVELKEEPDERPRRIARTVS
jgi:hypothetical protein